jgi:hypothetical protein
VLACFLLAQSFVGGLLPAVDLGNALSHRESAGLDKTTTYYLSTNYVPESQVEPLETALRFVVPSLSLEPTVDYQVPQPIGNGLLLIDLDPLGWTDRFHKIIGSQSPYSSSNLPLVIRADWFLQWATDAAESDAYYRLTFGQRYKTRQEFSSALGVYSAADDAMAWVEGDSGVVVSQKRWIYSLGSSRGYAWATRDSENPTGIFDPLERLDGGGKHDAEEWIVGVPKFHVASGKRGALQVYFLSDGNGKTVDAAPPTIATDHSRVRRGQTEVRNGVSCIACHASGLIDVKRNEVRELLDSGVDVLTKDRATQRLFERLHLTDIQGEIEKNRDQFATIMQAVTGKEPREAVADYVASIKWYDSDLSLGQAAREIGVSADDLSAAIVYGQSVGKVYSSRVLALGRGVAIPRRSWETDYLSVLSAVKLWSQKP